MTIVADRVLSFLTERRGEAYCEDCIQREAGVARRKDVQDALHWLGVSRTQYTIQLRDLCAQCQTERVLTARN